MSRPPVEGFVDDRFTLVGDVFAEVVSQGEGTGSAVAAWHDGGWVVDLWGGYADAARTRPWRRDSIVMPYSVTKPFAAVCVLLLVDRGSVDLDAPLSTYWPGFGAKATVRQVLAHQAGVVVLDENLPTSALYDHEWMCRVLERQRPLWEPGTAQGEAALVYGHLLGEVVRRVDGRSLGTFLREEICEPRSLDFHIGLGPDELARAVELTGYDEEFWQGWAEYDSLMRRCLSNPPGALDPAVVSSKQWRRAEIGAVNGHGTARAVAGLYVELMRGGLLSSDLLAEMRRPQAVGHDRVLGVESSWGLGVSVDPDGFGMGGVGGSFGWWSNAGQYAFAFVTGHIGDPARGDRLDDALREVLGLPPA